MIKKIFNHCIDIIALYLIIIVQKILYKFSINKIRSFGAFLGKVWYYLIPIRKRTVIYQIKKVFPEMKNKKVKKIAVNCFSNLGITTIELIMSSKTYPELIKNIEIEGWEKYENLKNNKKPIVAVTAHIGNWDILSASVISRGVNLKIISKTLSLPKLNDFWLDQRKNLNLKIIPPFGTLTEILRWLKAQNVIGFVVDQRPVRESLKADLPFLGLNSYTTLSPAVIAKKSKAFIVPIYCIRKTDGNYKIIIEDPIDPSNGSYENITLQINNIVSKWIMGYPDQWLWHHRRWKR